LYDHIPPSRDVFSAHRQNIARAVVIYSATARPRVAVGESLKKWKKLATCGSRKSHQNKKIGATKNLMIVLLIH